MRNCSTCKLDKPLTEFYKHRDGLQSKCKLCQNEYSRIHYRKHKKKYIDRANKQKEKVLSWFVEYKSKQSCSECGESHPACLDFHHKDQSEKYASVSYLVSVARSKDVVMLEIDKCIVLCANCHRKLHYCEASSKRYNC